MTRKPKWNPRYVEYARAHGRTSEEQQKCDEKELRALGFPLWNWNRLNEAQAQGIRGEDHDEWLHRWVDEHLDRKVTAQELIS